MATSLAYTPDRAEELTENIKEVAAEVQAAAGQRALGSKPPRLVAVSKIKPASDIQALYDAGYRHFGENYIQELKDKAKELPTDIKWHFIGSLQSNKVNWAAAIPNLFILETLESQKLAALFQKRLASTPEVRSTPLNVYIQVNTSGEDNKSGLPPSLDSESENSVLGLAKYILSECPNLRLLGLMTIGSFEHSHAVGEKNPDFIKLLEVRNGLQAKLKEISGAEGRYGDEVGLLEVSMGMSADFAEAVKEGSDSVRVGTRIFGERPKKN